jgi:hypothetical protein
MMLALSDAIIRAVGILQNAVRTARSLTELRVDLQPEAPRDRVQTSQVPENYKLILFRKLETIDTDYLQRAQREAR